MELVSVTSVNDVGQANVIKGVLEQAGIEAVLSSSGAEDVFPPGTIDTVHVLVQEADVQKARDLLDQYETLPEPGEEDE